MTCRIVISGYFCTGKTSVMEMLSKEFHLKKPVDYTTRNMRPNEREGFPYTFISKEKFLELAGNNLVFDPIEHAGNHYAVDLKSIMEGKRWIMDILPDSWEVFKKIPGVIGIYLIPPGEAELRRRAAVRGDLAESIEKRLKAVKLQDLESYDYVIEPQASLEDLHRKIRGIVLEKLKYSQALIREMDEALEQYLKSKFQMTLVPLAESIKKMIIESQLRRPLE